MSLSLSLFRGVLAAPPIGRDLAPTRACTFRIDLVLLILVISTALRGQ